MCASGRMNVVGPKGFERDSEPRKGRSITDCYTKGLIGIVRGESRMRNAFALRFDPGQIHELIMLCHPGDLLHPGESQAKLGNCVQAGRYSKFRQKTTEVWSLSIVVPVWRDKPVDSRPFSSKVEHWIEAPGTADRYRHWPRWSRNAYLARYLLQCLLRCTLGCN